MTSETELGGTAPVVDALVQVSFAVLGVLTRTAAEYDVSVTQLRLLGILRDRTPTMAALANFLGLDRSSVSGLIDRAELRGLVARRASSKDARVTTVELTTDGLALGQRLAATVGSRIEDLLSGASADERAQLVRLVAPIIGTTPS